MHNYLARVVLHRLNTKGNDSSEDYQDFHALMKAIGFENFITGVDKKTYILPGGMYYLDGNAASAKAYTLESVYAAVYAVVTEVVKDETKYIRDANNPHSVFVTQTGNSQWEGLKSPVRIIRGTSK
jgi:hypothetical protein